MVIIGQFNRFDLFMISEEVFRRFVPEAAVAYCDKLYQSLGFEFKIKKNRQTKLGDYRYNPNGNKHTISINNDLNPYAFLVTYLHEVAHLTAFKKYGRTIQPHGKEWKACFRKVAFPLLKDEVFPNAVLAVLEKYFSNPKASSCSDPILYEVLRTYDLEKRDTVFLKEISVGQLFSFGKKNFIKLEKKRTRSVCEQVETKRKYLISEMAEVNSLNQ
ncbi:MAG: SprT-like domain-containing protein [Ekhidna sp.]|nr:SprT-like domain-containing protein [Ekhidna sp.]